MILLYPSTETEFQNNGLGALPDAISCTVTEERNGMYELEMQYPVSGSHYGEIVNRAILFCKPDPYRDPQPFRIYRILKPISGRVTVYAQHISYDLSGVTVSPFSAGSCAGALDGLKANAVPADMPFSFWTDKSTSGNFSVDVPSSLRSLLGGTEGSILDVYGGEYEFDRWTVKLWNQRGKDSGVTIRYGKNLTDLQQDENISNLATGIYPYWKGGDGELVEVPGKVVNAPGTYDFTRIVPVDFTSDFQDQPTPEQLRSRAETYVETNDIGVPTVSLSVSFQPLEQTEEYKDIALLERVNLCDTVTVEYPTLGVSATAKCVKTVYDALKNRYTSIELGEARTNIADTIAGQQQEIEQLPESSAFQEAVSSATGWITGNRGGYVVIRDSNGDRQPDEILIMDTPDIQTAQKVWRWNNGGLGYSSNGYNGPYTTAITQDGAIVASFITAGILNGSIIKTGRIQGQTEGGPYFDLLANGGKGEIAASILRGVEDGSTTIAQIGLGTYVDGYQYEGLNLVTTSGAGGGITLALERNQGDYTLANNSEINSSGNLLIRSQAIASNPGGNNSINLVGNSKTGEGTVEIRRGKSDGSEAVLLADNAATTIRFNGKIAFGVWDNITELSYDGESILDADSNTTNIYSPNGKIQFVTGKHASASIEKDGSARFGDLYTNGVKVTSDREKKENIQTVEKSALNMVNTAKAYEYNLRKNKQKRIGIMYDEAPECIRSEENGKTIDLYGMASLLWKSVQELDEKIEKVIKRDK